MDEIVQEFLVESLENLDQLDRDLVALEAEPDSRELLSSIFRTIHTIKGTSGFLAFGRLEAVTHVGENLLSRLRDGELRMTPTTTDALLRMVDTVRALLDNIEQTGAEGEVDVQGVVELVQACMESPAKAIDPEPAAAAAQAPIPVASPDSAAAAAEPADAAAKVKKPKKAKAKDTADKAPEENADEERADKKAAKSKSAKEKTGSDKPQKGGAAEPSALQPPADESLADGLSGGAASPAEVDPVLAAADVVDLAAGQRADGVAHVPAQAQAAPGDETAAPAAAAANDGPDAGSSAPRRSVADSTIRVDVELLDSLMRLVGELVLTRNQVVQYAAGLHDVNLVRSTQRLNLIASELQEGVMKTRMQPIDHLWAKLPRVVRDLSQSLSKQIELVMVGRDTELDRTLLEAIKDPLTHIVRNSVDHGIETPEVRRAAGKPGGGVLTLRAYHQSGQVVVEVSDNGGGIDPGRVGPKAVERGLITREQLERMSDRDILDLVFKPGFSTAEKVSNISGRGVGMDVVRTNIEAIGGTVELDSVKGKGTTTRLTIPLTLAIVPALTVECGGERYAIPQISLLELVFLDDPDNTDKRGVEFVSGAPVYRLRGNLLPLVYLDEVLGLPDRGTREGAAYIAVLQAEDRRFGLVVDRVLNTEEIVVKSLGARLKSIGLYAGATITGDGRVALILDAQALARRSHVAMEAVERAAQVAAQEAATAAVTTERLLVVAAGGHRIAIPVDMVTRLEEFHRSMIERSGGREVVQYRGQIVPVLRLAEMFGGYSDPEMESSPVVVYSENGRTIALGVEQIIDIVEDAVEVRTDLNEMGVMGSAVIQDRVTELLDVRQAILSADPGFFAGFDDYNDPDAYGVQPQMFEGAS